MMKRKLYLLLIILLSKSAFAQPTELRGMYIDHFSTVLGNINKEDSLLHYAQDSSFNYLALYDLHNLDLTNANTANMLSVFINGQEKTSVYNMLEPLEKTLRAS